MDNQTNNQQNQIDREKLLAAVPKISPKFKKEDLISAYNELLEKYKEGVFKEHGQTAESKSEYSREKIVKEADDFKESFSSVMEKLENKVVSEFEKLVNIKESISVKKRELERVYDIEISLEHLGFLLRENMKMKKNLAIEIEEARRKWEDEKREKERKLKWEKEEREYAFSFKKQKTEDELKEELEKKKKEFFTEQNKKEEESKERENNLQLEEERLKNLKAEVLSFPQQIEKIKKETEEKTAKQIKSEYETAFKFQEEKYKASLGLASVETKNLKAIIVGLENEIKNLTEQLGTNKSQLQEIVLKVIEEKKAPVVEKKEEESREQR